MLALLDLYLLEGNREWLKFAEKLGAELKSAPIFKEDYAYYPDSFIGGTLCMPRGGWKSTEEPPGWDISQNYHKSDSAIVFAHGGIVRALCRLYTLNGDEKALELSGQLVKFMQKPRRWIPDDEPKGVFSSERAHFSGHLHCYCWRLWGEQEVGDNWEVCTSGSAEIKRSCADTTYLECGQRASTSDCREASVQIND
jgi:uncharacterized protein YyaL (SSP411 family)